MKLVFVAKLLPNHIKPLMRDRKRRTVNIKIEMFDKEKNNKLSDSTLTYG